MREDCDAADQQRIAASGANIKQLACTTQI